jgi:hypothetical protein
MVVLESERQQIAAPRFELMFQLKIKLRDLASSPLKLSIINRNLVRRLAHE